jgi:hypothetical protein
VSSKPQWLDLENLPNAFTFQEGFSRPDWKLIADAVKEKVEKSELGRAFDEVALQWLTKLAGELGGDYHVMRSSSFALVSVVKEDEAAKILKASERVLERITDFLGAVTRKGPQGLRVILLFAEEDDYYQYISYFYSEGTHPTSGGICLAKGYIHIAVRYHSESSTVQIISHELAHNCIAHLTVPRWLHEGLAQLVEKVIGESRHQLLPDDMVERHHRFWNEERIQGFWAGTSFGQPGDSVELSYSLSEVLMQLLATNREDFLAFIQSARFEDGGQDAALECLGKCLGDLAGQFLGPGNWRPQRKAIKQCWEVARPKAKSGAGEPASRRG